MLENRPFPIQALPVIARAMARNVTASWHRHSEHFDRADWDDRNREFHWEKHQIDFPAVRRMNWDRIVKRKDVEHPDNPPRYKAIVADLQIPGIAYHVVYQKRTAPNRVSVLWVIEIRFADDDEAALLDAS